MSKKANKQRMKRRLVAAVEYHHPDPLEVAVMRDDYMRMTHTRLKQILRLVAAVEYYHPNVVTDGAGGYLLVAEEADKERARKWRAVLHTVEKPAS